MSGFAYEKGEVGMRLGALPSRFSGCCDPAFDPARIGAVKHDHSPRGSQADRSRRVAAEGVTTPEGRLHRATPQIIPMRGCGVLDLIGGLQRGDELMPPATIVPQRSWNRSRDLDKDGDCERFQGPDGGSG